MEDDNALRELARLFLEFAGYKVLETSSAAEALAVARTHEGPVHLLMTDVILPDMNGGALAAELVKLRPAMKVLFVSGYTDDAIVHHGVLESGKAFLQKPYVRDSLLRKVRELLGTP